MSVESTAPEDQRMDMGALLGTLLSRWLRIVIVTALLLAATFAVLLFVPKMYESSAGLLVEQRVNALTRVPNEQPAQPSIPVEAMMSSQIELIKSRDTLLSVIDSENLRSIPELTGAGASPISLLMQLIGRKPADKSLDEIVLQNLNERLTVVRERDSAVISILVRTTDPELSARIANAIANAHVSRRAGLSLSDTAEASQWLRQEIERLRVKVHEAETAVANYRVDNDLYSGANNTSILDQQLSNIAGQITTAQERKNAARSRADLIRGLLDAGQSIDGVPDVRASVVVQQLTQSRATLQGELAQRSSTLLPNHPAIKALNAQIREIEEQIAIEGRRVADALEAEAEIEGNVEASLRDDLTRLKLSVSTATRDNVTLESLEREAKAQRDLLESYLLRHGEAVSRTESSSALPDVRVVTVAAPAVQPASPKTALILGAVGFVTLTLQIGGILFGELMSGRALTDRHAYRQVDEPEFDDIDDDAEALESEGNERPTVAEVPESAKDVLPPGPVEAFETEFVEDADEDIAEVASGRAEFEPEPQIAAPGAEAAPSQPDALELDNLMADLVAGKERVVMLAALGGFGDCLEVSDVLAAGCLDNGLTVVCVDAGSGHQTIEPGLTDLCADRASFGDVVHRVGEGLAEVPWGSMAALERRSMKPATLLAALTDIYEVVIVATGRIGMTSTLPIFAGVDCRLVLVGGERPDAPLLEAAREDAAALGYQLGQVVSLPRLRSKVA
ncbi:MAG: GumC family protein [Devosia sp.]